jgi:quinol monooxygenase YgiN
MNVPNPYLIGVHTPMHQEFTRHPDSTATGCQAHEEHFMSSIRSIVRVLVLVILTSTAAPTLARDAGGVRYVGIPPGAYAVVAHIRAKPGKEQELRAATLPLVAKVRAEPNNLLYFLQEDRESPGHFVFYEIFASQADFEAHNATEHVQAWFAKLPELADGGVQVMRLEILGNLTSTGASK